MAGDKLWLFYPGHSLATEINFDASQSMCLCLPSSYSLQEDNTWGEGEARGGGGGVHGSITRWSPVTSSTALTAAKPELSLGLEPLAVSIETLPFLPKKGLIQWGENNMAHRSE